MSSAKIIIAEATSNSVDDSYGRITITSEGLYEDFGPVMVLGSRPITKGEKVFVDISSGYHTPVVLDRYLEEYDGDYVLFESSDGSDWTKAVVNKNVLTITNSDDVEVKIDGKNISISTGGSIKIESDQGLSIDCGNKNVDISCQKLTVNNTSLEVT